MPLAAPVGNGHNDLLNEFAPCGPRLPNPRRRASHLGPDSFGQKIVPNVRWALSAGVRLAGAVLYQRSQGQLYLLPSPWTQVGYHLASSRSNLVPMLCPYGASPCQGGPGSRSPCFRGKGHYIFKYVIMTDDVYDGHTHAYERCGPELFPRLAGAPPKKGPTGYLRVCVSVRAFSCHLAAGMLR